MEKQDNGGGSTSSLSGPSVERLLLLISLFLLIIAVVSFLSLVQPTTASSPSNPLSGYFIGAQSAGIQTIGSMNAQGGGNPPSSLLPDLISGLSPKNPNVRTGSGITIYVKTTNLGPGIAGQSMTGVYSDASGKSFGVPRLARGESSTKTFTYYCNSAGYHPITSVADALNQVRESNEYNNNFTTVVNCVGNYVKPDLISRFENTTNGSVYGVFRSNVTLSEVTSNVGLGAALQSYTRVYLDNQTLAVFSKPALAPGGSSRSKVSYYCGKVGSYLISSKADYDNRVDESSESNNIGIVYLVCG